MTQRVHLCGDCLTSVGMPPTDVGFAASPQGATCWHCLKDKEVVYPFNAEPGMIRGVYVVPYILEPMALLNPEDE